MNSEKPAIPTLWLDTSVVIKLTKIERGEALQQIEVARLTRLRELAQELVASGKLLCCQSDQEEEYVAQRLDKEIHGEFATLSLGVKLRHRQGIFDSQVQLGMQARVQQAETIKVPFSTYFHSDPIEQLNDARRRPFVIVLHPFRDAEMLTRSATAKAQVCEIWENLRQEFVAERRTYAQQLQAEQQGYADAVVQKLQEFDNKVASGTIPDFWEFTGVQGLLFYRLRWRALGGQPSDLSGLYDFFCSRYFNNLPIPRIRAQLGADLLTGNQQILPGDVMDTELLSVAIPVAHYILTDRRMSERVRRLGIERDWNAEVYSMSDLEGLFGQLEALR